MAKKEFFVDFINPKTKEEISVRADLIQMVIPTKGKLSSNIIIGDLQLEVTGSNTTVIKVIEEVLNTQD